MSYRSSEIAPTLRYFAVQTSASARVPDGVLYGVQNGRDFLSLYWPILFTIQDHVVLPAEELVRIEQDKPYGWPYCYFDAMKNLRLLNPESGGRVSHVGVGN